MEVKKDLLGNDNGHNPEDKKDDQPPVDKVEEKTIEDLEDDIETIDDPVILKQKIKELKDLKAKLESNHQRGVQKILKDKREAETYIETFKKSVRAVRDDKSALVQIHKEHPKIAKEILEEYFDGISINTFIKEELDGVIPEDKFDPEKEREKIRKEVEEEENKAKAERLLNKYLKEVDEDLHEEVKEEFNGIIGNRKLTTELIKKYFKVALSVVAPPTKTPKDTETVKAQAQKQGTPSSKSANSTTDWVKEYIRAKNKAEGRSVATE